MAEDLVDRLPFPTVRHPGFSSLSLPIFPPLQEEIKVGFFTQVNPGWLELGRQHRVSHLHPLPCSGMFSPPENNTSQLGLGILGCKYWLSSLSSYPGLAWRPLHGPSMWGHCIAHSTTERRRHSMWTIVRSLASSSMLHGLTICQVLAFVKRQKAHLDRNMDDNKDPFSSLRIVLRSCGRSKTALSTTEGSLSSHPPAAAGSGTGTRTHASLEIWRHVFAVGILWHDHQ